MAGDPVAPRFRAAKLSRRALLGGIASTPVAAAVRINPSPSAWELALKSYSAAHHRYEAFLATSLQPAYARYKGALAQSGLREFDHPPLNAPYSRDRITAAERQILEAGGGRAEIVRLRAIDPEHAHLRAILAADLRLRRARARLMRRHDVFLLEDKANDLRAGVTDALHELLTIPAADRTGLLLKVRLSYAEIFRHDDYDGLLRAIFADVERLCG